MTLVVKADGVALADASDEYGWTKTYYTVDEEVVPGQVTPDALKLAIEQRLVAEVDEVEAAECAARVARRELEAASQWTARTA
jgi:hypothetical protein